MATDRRFKSQFIPIYPLQSNLYPPTVWEHLKSRKQEYPRCCNHPVKKERKFIEEKFPTRNGEKIAGEPLTKMESTRRKRRTLEYIWELKKYLFGGRLATRSLAEVCSLPGGLPNPLCTFQCIAMQPNFDAFCILFRILHLRSTFLWNALYSCTALMSKW